MQQNSGFNTFGPAIVHQEELAALSLWGQAQSPKSWGSPFGGSGTAFGVSVVERWTHIVHEQIGVGVKGFVGKGFDG